MLSFPISAFTLLVVSYESSLLWSSKGSVLEMVEEEN